MPALPEPTRWQPPPGSRAVTAAVTQPGGELRGGFVSGSGHRFCCGAARGFAESLGWEPTLAMGASHHQVPGGAGASGCCKVPLRARVAPAVEDCASEHPTPRAEQQAEDDPAFASCTCSQDPKKVRSRFSVCHEVPRPLQHCSLQEP